ncbi:MAG: metallophosphoesterase [Helicobacteraceae bacterium]|nr:metallophosphoesterase [Helicobacteraceae bacterium]
MSVFFIFMICCFGVFHLIGYYALIKHASKNLKFRLIGGMLLIINFILLIIYLMLLRNTTISDIVVRILSLSVLVALLVCTLGIFNVIFLIIGRFIKSFSNVLISKILLSLLPLGIIVGIYGAHKTPELTYQTIEIKNLKKDINILFLSDLHISNLISKEKIQNTINLANSTNPDIIVLGGDIIDSYEDVIKDKIPLLGELNAKYGVYFVLGNHEFIFDANKSLEIVSKFGNITPLVNSSIIIDDNINLIGISDLMGRKVGYLEPNIEEALKNTNDNLPKILISHQPNIINEFDSNVDLILSGHTHGGQVFPFTILAYLKNPFLYGLKTINNIQLYISQGSHLAVTYGRIGTQSEINLITLKAGFY